MGLLSSFLSDKIKKIIFFSTVVDCNGPWANFALQTHGPPGQGASPARGPPRPGGPRGRRHHCWNVLCSCKLYTILISPCKTAVKVILLMVKEGKMVSLSGFLFVLISYMIVFCCSCCVFPFSFSIQWWCTTVAFTLDTFVLCLLMSLLLIVVAVDCCCCWLLSIVVDCCCCCWSLLLSLLLIIVVVVDCCCPEHSWHETAPSCVWSRGCWNPLQRPPFVSGSGRTWPNGSQAMVDPWDTPWDGVCNLFDLSLLSLYPTASSQWLTHSHLVVVLFLVLHAPLLSPVTYRCHA